MLTCASVITELITSRAVDRSSPTTMGMWSVPGSMGVMVDGNRPASLCPVLSRPVDLSFVRYRRGVGFRRSPRLPPLTRSVSIGRIRMPLWSALVVRLQWRRMIVVGSYLDHKRVRWNDADMAADIPAGLGYLAVGLAATVGEIALIRSRRRLARRQLDWFLSAGARAPRGFRWAYHSWRDERWQDEGFRERNLVWLWLPPVLFLPVFALVMLAGAVAEFRR